jgi:hypothetical protein
MFTAFAELVVGQEYHFKFAIGDAIDTALDSGVIMRKGSVSNGANLNGLTVQVNTEGIDVDAEGLFVSGTFNFFQPEPMQQVSDNVYAFTAMVPASMNISYRFFNGSGEDASELVPENCSVEGVDSDGMRNLVTTNETTVLDPICFGTCETCTEFLSVDNSNQEPIKVFPNPSEGLFQVQSPQEGFARVQVFNILGSMVVDERMFLNSGENYTIEVDQNGLYKMSLSFEDSDLIYQTTVVVE